jgi:hypothetical protein
LADLIGEISDRRRENCQLPGLELNLCWSPVTSQINETVHFCINFCSHFSGISSRRAAHTRHS